MWILLSVVVAVVLQQAAAAQRKLKYIYIHYIAKSIGTPSNERFDYFINFHECKS